MSTDHIINPAAIEALRAVSPEDGGAFLTELIDIFLADTPPRVAAIENALVVNDTDGVIRAAHSIKGSAGNFGAERLARLAHTIETAAKKNDLATAAAQLADFKEAYTSAAAMLQTLRKS